MSNFQLSAIPSQKGRVAIVTGANAGLGFETTKALAQKEATVIMACRNANKAKKAIARIKRDLPQAELEFLALDLSKLDAVRQFATQFKQKYNRLDLLINNAGVMMPPYQKTADGFELQFGVNHLGHFLLTDLLLDVLLATENSRVVSLSSIAHKNGEINFDDLQSEQKYSKIKAYGQSKLACLLFAIELDRRLLQTKGHSGISVAAHPGVSPTELSRHIPTWAKVVFAPLFWFISHKPEKGALATLQAALDPKASGGEYYGPQGFREMKGEPGKASIAPQALDKATASRLWEISEQLTGAEFGPLRSKQKVQG